MKVKSFKIGESAVGGIIRVNVSNAEITVEALHHTTKDVVRSHTFDKNYHNLFWEIKDFLTDLTSLFHTEKVMTWVEKNAKVEHQTFNTY